tara:strand:+ start:6866 stop:8680 length:1815 start_codon:yes stop_codon:yes gene_type:complete
MKIVNYWWNEKSEPHEELFSAVAGVVSVQSGREQDNVAHMSLYGNAHYTDMASFGDMGSTPNTNHRVTLNIIQSMCDTVTAKVAKARPRATYLTHGGNWSMQKKAKLLERFTDGQFYSTDIYSIAPQVFMDACVFGTGCMYIYQGDGKIEVERVFPGEILVDDHESRYAKPRQMFRRKIMAKDVLVGMFPEAEKKINEAVSYGEGHSEYKASEQVECIEAWHLPCYDGAKDGRRVIAIENCTLLDEPWERSEFPFVFIRWSNRLMGFWGQGLAEQLTGLQLEINNLLSMIQEQMHLATPKVFVENGSEIVPGHLNNEIWGIVKYNGTPPQMVAPRTTSPEIFAHLDRLYSRAYEIAGVSQLAAQSKKPSGLDSGVALREFQDIETERFMIVAQHYEKLFLEAAEQMIGLAREISKNGNAYEVLSHGDKDIQSIKWSDIDLKRDQYVMKVYPTSLLPTTPAAKLQKVIEMVQAGMIDNQEARGLLDYPDLEAVNQLATASSDGIKLMIEDMVEHGRYHPPEPFMNLSMAIAMIQSAYLRAKINNAPEENLDLLRRFMQEAIDMLSTMAQGATAPAPAMGGPEMGAPPANMGPDEVAAEQMAAPIQ